MFDAPSVTLAFAAGFISFVSPCCLPLVPGYLATVCGKPAEGSGIERAVVQRSLIFIAGFSAVFILLGLSATAIGSMLRDYSVELQRIAGAAIVMLGLFFVGTIFIVRLNRDWRMASLDEKAAHGGPLLAGVAFAFAWTPCVGPTLAAILGLASLEGSAAQGAGLLAVYSLGLALPFLLSAIAFGATQRSLSWFRRNHRAIQLVSGLTLIAMGVLVYTNELFRLNAEAQQLLDGLGLNFFQSV